MGNYLLIDLGASRTKTVLLNTQSGIFSDYRSYPTPRNIANLPGRFELSLKELNRQFLSICNWYHKKSKGFKGIMLSSQMHGFILVNNLGQPLTNYISWKDERSLEPVKGKSTFDLLVGKLGKKFNGITGMRARPSLPFFNATHAVRELGVTGCRILTLPDWIAGSLGHGQNITHETMLAGLGFYDIYNRNISLFLQTAAREVGKCDFAFNHVTGKIVVAGYWQKGGKNIPIYTAVGDHQCAVLGANNKPKLTISLNIGTGSQVSVIGITPSDKEVEFRPYFNSMILATITHIPAGRALEYYLNQVKKRSLPKLWRDISRLKAEEILRAKRNISLSIFPGAWRFSPENLPLVSAVKRLGADDLLPALVKSLAKQYVSPINKIDPEHRIKSIILSGGIPNKIPKLKDVLEKFTQRIIKYDEGIDETFLGMKKLIETSKL